jgi:16S rRNA (cytosine1407-C5)-methyltransferase
MDRYFRVCAPEDKIPFVRDLLNAQGFESSGLSFWEKAFKLEVSPFSLGNSLASFFGLIYIQDH